MIQWNYSIKYWSYDLDNDAYLFEIYFKDMILCEVLFYDEDIEKKMTIQFFHEKNHYDFMDFYKSLELIINELKRIIKEKKIQKNIF